MRLWRHALIVLLAASAMPALAQTSRPEPPLESYHLPADQLLAELELVAEGASLSNIDLDKLDRLLELARRLQEEGQASDACRVLLPLADPDGLVQLAEAARSAMPQAGTGNGFNPFGSALDRLVEAYRSTGIILELCNTTPARSRPADLARLAPLLTTSRATVRQMLDGLTLETDGQRRIVERIQWQAASRDLIEEIRESEQPGRSPDRLNRHLRCGDPDLAARLAGLRYRSIRQPGAERWAVTFAGMAYLRALIVAGDEEGANRVRAELGGLLPSDAATMRRLADITACADRAQRENGNPAGCATPEDPVEYCQFAPLAALLRNDAAGDGLPAVCADARRDLYPILFARRFEQLRQDRSPAVMVRMYLTDHAAKASAPDDSYILPDPLRPGAGLWPRIRLAAAGAEPDAASDLFRLIQGFDRRPVVSDNLEPTVDVDLALATGRHAAAAAGQQAAYDDFITQLTSLRNVATRSLLAAPTQAAPRPIAGQQPPRPTGPEASVGSSGPSGNTGAGVVQAWRERPGAVAALERANAVLAARVPDWSEIISVAPVPVETVRRLLGPDEALILVDSRHYGTTTIAVTAEGARVNISFWDRSRMARAVQRLTYELGAQSVTRGSTIELTWESLTEFGGLYSVGLAHDIYAQTVGPLAPALAGKRHLIVVASGPIQSLPFSTLVSRAPVRPMLGGTELRDSHWLIDDFAISQLPSVRAFQLLRRRPGGSADAGRPLSFVGIGMTGGTPLQNAAPGADVCQLTRGEGRNLAVRMRAANEANYSSPFALRDALPALPCVRTDLDLVASALGDAQAHTVLGDQATEAFVRSNDVASADLLLFATHGLTARPASGLQESALVLHPLSNEPASDGLLISSEIARLSLTADWVILSACNSGTGTDANSPPLEGLAQAFFLAGARSLLVSFWPVVDEVAPRITASAISSVHRNTGVTRAAGLREAMIAARRRDDPTAVERNYAHPSRWASFTLIGD